MNILTRKQLDKSRGTLTHKIINLCFPAALVLMLCGNAIAQDEHDVVLLEGEVWTEADWVDWWFGIEDLYLSGLPEEGLYWLLRHDLEVLGQAEPLLDQIEIPPPYSGWTDPGGPGPQPPMDPLSDGEAASDRLQNGAGYSPNYAGMPSEWVGLVEEHGIQTQPIYVPPPPMWVGVSISALGGILASSTHPGVVLVGRVMIGAGGIIIIWIHEEGGEEDDE